jgi:elongator complex protein 1
LLLHSSCWESVAVFVEAGKPPKALIAFEKALEWQELFDLAARDEMDEEEFAAMGVRVAGKLFTHRMK